MRSAAGRIAHGRLCPRRGPRVVVNEENLLTARVEPSLPALREGAPARRHHTALARGAVRVVHAALVVDTLLPVTAVAHNAVPCGVLTLMHAWRSAMRAPSSRRRVSDDACNLKQALSRKQYICSFSRDPRTMPDRTYYRGICYPMQKFRAAVCKISPLELNWAEYRTQVHNTLCTMCDARCQCSWPSEE